ncbi:hypothetical protein PIB30_063656 [Stylosanthes scabra]|uniref:Uncharacterized protein n=1 Tax=Stylosanthes scabra TaxID=79078 RepID=A0ABU6YM90_9FABA|nr:hypothetical protein [Stylosanthes scabra]
MASSLNGPTPLESFTVASSSINLKVLILFNSNRCDGRKCCHSGSPSQLVRPFLAGSSVSRTQVVPVRSVVREGTPLPPPSPTKKCPAIENSTDPKRPRVSEGGSQEFCLMDCSFDASGFIGGHLLGPRAREILCDCDPMDSVRWAEWAMVRATTIMKSMEPRLAITDEAKCRSAKLLGDLKVLNLLKVVLEEENVEAMQAKLKAKEDLESALAHFRLSENEKNAEIERLRAEELELSSAVGDLQFLATDERVRADLANALAADLGVGMATGPHGGGDMGAPYPHNLQL